MTLYMDTWSVETFSHFTSPAFQLDSSRAQRDRKETSDK